MTQTSRHTNTKLFKDPVQFSYNRYDNILPYEYSMVRLGNDNSDPVNYINANYITTVVKDYNFIATQGPLTSTITNFWKMVEQNDV
jgi:protein tyrosine phosphatase